MICAAQVVQSGGKNIELAVIRRNQPLKVIHLIYDFFCIFILYNRLDATFLSSIKRWNCLSNPSHDTFVQIPPLSPITDSGVQRDWDAGRRNREGERGGGREEKAEEVIVNHSCECVVLFIWAEALGSGPSLYPLPSCISSVKSTVSQSSAEPTACMNMFLFQEIFFKI